MRQNIIRQLYIKPQFSKLSNITSKFQAILSFGIKGFKLIKTSNEFGNKQVIIKCMI